MSDFPPPGPPEFPASPPLAPPPPPVPPGSVPPGGLWSSPPSAPEPEPSRRVAPWVVVVAVLAVVGLLAGALLASTGGDDEPDDEQASGVERDDETTTTDTTEAPDDDEGEEEPPTTEAQPQDFDAVVAEIEAFVAAERGLPFLRDVTVTLLDDEAFEARLFEDFEEDTAEIVVTGQVLQAVGLVEPGTDMVEAVRSLLGGGVVGTYDPETDELLVRGREASPYVRTVIAHELVHALDDQHFELDRPALDDAPDESGYGFTALVEGNASRVEEAYRASELTPEEEDEAAAEELTIGSDTDIFALPLPLIESLYAPYLLGPLLVDAILDDGGQARLDAAFAAPPATSEALLDPSTYLEGQTALPVPPPVADGVEIDRHVLGALGLGQVIGETGIVFGGGTGEAVDGWGGDQYVAWVQGDQVCLRANIVGDTPEDTAEIAEALEDFAAAPPFRVTATVDATPELVSFTSCG
jgi:hypothetical protein